MGLNYHPEPSGNAPYTTSLAEGLAAAGHSVHVVTGFPHYPEWSVRAGYGGWSRDEIINGVHIRRLRHYVPRRPTALGRLHMELSFGLRLFFEKWQQPDVVLVVSPALFSCALAILRARVFSRGPAVAIWVQDLYSRGVVETASGGRVMGRFATLLESLILKATDGVAAIHERFKRHMVDTLGVPTEKIRVIRNWTHLPQSPELDGTDIRARLGWREDQIVVLHAGNMGKKQGLENVVDAARVAESDGSNVRFVLMGDGNQRERLQALACGVSTITFEDSLPNEEFQSALAAADVLLVNELPGLKDMAVPSKLTSYFNAGVPVVAATDRGSVTAYEIESSGAGIRVDPGVPRAIVTAVENLAKDPSIRARLAENGLRYRRDRLDEKVAVAHYDDFIKSLASSRGR
ncbi:glycosyltransferase family 4 protein [Arthrobacter sp. StoSoilB19]|uniref:glycosyltransferase family 4 protein n=1 Tax=Arthrobacter sp. StoSoilB19 TaxID=2830994 RepID=UPI001CC79D16|nr:glycosyltransferase family 4 protein [Arthrobacter sp. StoSoilB19]